ncbi:AAA domain-containing protein [Massilia sp. CF038]|uniref:AAA domain-containing protein n=1 Tax=Massilia sp. CF038 TaxID=1881045 RepID=UPI00091ECF87|nr:AAA domain-containing protein [Massilia sp. CF038]SHG62363.1 AAA domain-containing protein [Massilia sp. CF038]
MSGPEAHTLDTLIAAQAGQPLSTDDVLMLLLPLFSQVAALHAEGKVAALDADAVLVGDEGGLVLRSPLGQAPRMQIDALHQVQPNPASGLNIIGALRREQEDSGRENVSDLALQFDANAPIVRPVYLPGSMTWEQSLGHHDEITDVFSLGMILASLACGLDFTDEADLQSFVTHRRNLFELVDRLNPIVAAIIVDMTEINRHQRATDVAALCTQLRNWREQPMALDVDRALSGAKGAAPRRMAVLAHLRDRLFDLSRRNRLLYFRPSASTVNLTVASVPLMLQIDSVRAEQICTWGGPFAQALLSGKPVALQSWLRFDDQPYLPPALDQLISETRRDRAEFGFSNLRVVVAFLRWHNLKETPEERIVTPLLWLPLELAKRKGVRDQYLVQCAGSEAEFNPVLRHQLQQLYDIELPETVDLETTTIAAIHADILAQIRRTEPAVELRLVDKVAIKMVRQKAMQRMQQYQRRRPGTARRASAGWLPPYSYARDDYRPLGRALFEHYVRPAELPQRFEAGAAPGPSTRQPQMVEAVEEREGYVLQESEGHRYAWDLDLTQVTLANFNYKKMSLVRDYAQLLDGASANPAFDRVFSIEPRAVETNTPPPLPAAEQWSVVASDATQQTAVALARSGRSFIIQGPPGTGKSQTITNLIADYAGRGKRVLFVCEKRAALDVVFHRLKHSGLEALCCLIHDSQTDKKAFIADLKACYERWIGQTDEGATLAAQRDALVERVDAHQRLLDTFEAAMGGVTAELGMPVRALLRRLAALPAAPQAGPALREQLPSYAAWLQQGDLPERVHRTMRERFGLDSLAAHPFSRLGRTLLLDEHAYSRTGQLCETLEAVFDTLDPLLDSQAALINADDQLAPAAAIAADCQWLLDSGLVSHLNLLDTGSTAHAALRTARQDLAARAAALAGTQAATGNWRDKLSPDDTDSALTQVRAMEPSIMRWLNPAWWRLRAELKRRYDFAQHAIHPGYTKVLAALADEHAAARALEAADSGYRVQYGVERMQAFMQHFDTLEKRLQQNDGPHRLITQLRALADPVSPARMAARSHAALAQLVQHAAALRLERDTTLGQVSELARDLRESLDELPDLLPLLRAVDGADPACAFVMQRIDQAPLACEALIADETLSRLERGNPVLASFGGAALAQTARIVAQGQRDLLALNAQLVGAKRHTLFADHVHTSSLAAGQLDADGKNFKKSYATGRRELEHEFGKSMRHRSIRDLSDDETGMVVNDLKPVWLMSPLSVSDTLPLSADLFDVVIFDEASQIPTEEAVPALSRARQVIVVGDEMQLPPTSFFSAGAGEADNEIVVQEEGESIAISLDSDSLLNQAARNLPATMLAWHYRSRHEALISFSNAAFYDGRLVTIPDRALEQQRDQTLLVRSDQHGVGELASAAVMAQPISFHRIADGVYVERRNAPEARYIAEMVRDLLRRDTGMSLGVVAFSEAQQSAIEAALEALAEEDADFATNLAREYVREDEDQFNGLFVKNLENVQGDERDVIILSICYAPGPEGKMLMNFGPINQRGGEKRLNVIFSRARHRMAVVSTIQAEAITNVHNDGAAALRSFLQFAQAGAAGKFEQAQAVLGAMNHGARNAFARATAADSIRDAIADALRARGHDVHVDVGRSQFRCDLAIVAKDRQTYALAILLDKADSAAVDTVERYVFRPGVLRSFGWQVLDIPGKDWRADPGAVLLRIESMLTSGEDRALAQEIVTLVQHVPRIAKPVPETASVPAAEPDPAASDAPPSGAAPDAAASLRFEQGTSRKFWRASVSACDLRVTYGRIGTAGQEIVKQFESAERARREMDKLVAEKLRKGYVEE